MAKSQAELRQAWLAWRASKGLSDGTGVQYSTGVSLSNIRIIPGGMPRRLSNAEQRAKAAQQAAYWAGELARVRAEERNR